jgi:hypothetical protein
MKFVSFLSSLSVVIVVVATRTQTVQAHNMRGGGDDAGTMIVIEEGRGLLDEFDGGFLSSLSMSMLTMPTMMMSMSMPNMMMSMSMPSEMLDPAEFGVPSTAAEEATTTTATATSSSKASKKKTGACDHRLELLQDTISSAYLDEWGEEAVNAKCHYQRSKGPNFGCTIGFSPPKTWSQGDMFFWEGRNADTYAALELYCECHLGIDRGCATKIPRQCMGDCEASFHAGNMIMSTTGVEKWLEYCKFAAVWNGDFLLSGDFQLAEDVEECGCYFISQERSNIDSCPGVKLGAFFPSPTPTTISPTEGSTPSITFAPTPADGSTPSSTFAPTQKPAATDFPTFTPTTM